MEHEEYCTRAEAEIARMARVAAGAAPETPVPSCPEWDLGKLVKHTGIVHRWATMIVATRAAERVPQNALDVGLPAERAQYPQWLAAGATPLVTALREAGPGVIVWTFTGDRDTSWWARRMLHETTVHRVDAELALGLAPELDAVAAADGIDEFLATGPTGSRISPRVAQLPGGQTIHLHATDEGLGEAGEWLISLGDNGYAWSHGHAKGTVAVRGPAALLLLLVYGRLRPGDERLRVFGDESLLATWQEIMTL
jgi:uncharacterized protein (TIGR03083 family)